MKRLYLLRHAKAGQTHKKLLADHERVLHPKGIEACPRIGAYLKRNRADFSLVLCSDSVRTTQTAERVLEAFGKKPPVEFRRDIYELESVEGLLNILHYTDDAHKSVMLVGHNPTLHMLSMQLAQKGRLPMIRTLIEHFPPGALAVFDLECDSWLELAGAESTLVDYVYPKELDES